ncbi:ABC transporter permease [Polymorphum gilvum]|uniref:Permease protein of oligopeptide ABC transporter n=1 Tax=Polymorphum gilvum (strain LMG 25793 / CGMCC 1.9160 / SL003B-26A1) TaxID=991905 RepID=F2J6D3_POLGS|nr:ABC transporter permease [Polymorphum gilvum]ADZ71307.1 Permease protein of oligopeptide ABC transporter [Polymorphum gilvum SL003B-26A1]
MSPVVAGALANRSFAAGAAITLVIALAALVSLAWTPHPIDVLSVADKLKGPSARHLLGTDQYGRDLLSMLMVGARTSIAVALIAVGIGLAVGVPLGLWAAGRRGLADDVLMRVNDLVFAFPALLSAVMITALLGPGAVNAILAIGIFNIPVFARVARGAALALSSREFLMAARVAGKSGLRITLEHVLPNIASVLIVQATIQFSLGILAEAGLSYVGLGAQPPLATWGRMLNEAQTMMAFAPQLALYPGLAIVMTVMGLNLLGDGLRDLTDPKLRQRQA